METKEIITLAAARINAGYTLVEVGEIIGRTASTISGWERGETEPKVSEAMKLAELYGRTVYTIDWVGGKK